jgi:hypothetical protein
MGQMVIRIDKKTGAISIDSDNLEEDRVLEMLKEMAEKITHLSCPEFEDDADPDDARQKYIQEQEQKEKERVR